MRASQGCGGGGAEGAGASAFESHHTQTDRCSHRQTDVPPERSSHAHTGARVTKSRTTAQPLPPGAWERRNGFQTMTGKLQQPKRKSWALTKWAEPRVPLLPSQLRPETLRAVFVVSGPEPEAPRSAQSASPAALGGKWWQNVGLGPRESGSLGSARPAGRPGASPWTARLSALCASVASAPLWLCNRVKGRGT